MNKSHLDQKRSDLTTARETWIAEFGEATRVRKPTAEVLKEIDRANDFLASLEQIERENSRGPDAPKKYVVSSLFLEEAYKKLTADRDEQFFFVTGAEVEGAFVLDQVAEFAHQVRHHTGVVGHMPSTHALLMKLEKYRHKFLAHFHSHPGEGPRVTAPSHVDREFQTRLERGGHVCLMAIFSRPGWVRFIRQDPDFEVEIYGEGCERYEPNVYQLSNLG